MATDENKVSDEIWSSNPAILCRLQQLMKLTQRTTFIAELLGLPESDIKSLKKTLKTMAVHAGVSYHPPSGRGGGQKRAQAFTTKIRFALSVLMGLLSNSSDDGLNIEAGLESGEWVDRLINTYHMYLHVSGQTNVDDPDVNFEWFYYSVKEIQQGTAVADHCDNCGSIHFHFHDAPAKVCPVCCQLRLAIVPRQSNATENWLKKSRKPAGHAPYVNTRGSMNHLRAVAYG